MVPEAWEESSVVGVRLPPNKKGLATLHNRDRQKMIAEGEEIIQEMSEVLVEVKELPIVVINAISWGIDHSSVQIMKKLNTEEHI